MHLRLHDYSRFVFQFPTCPLNESIFGSQFVFSFNNIFLDIIFSSTKILFISLKGFPTIKHKPMIQKILREASVKHSCNHWENSCSIQGSLFHALSVWTNRYLMPLMNKAYIYSLADSWCVWHARIQPPTAQLKQGGFSWPVAFPVLLKNGHKE